MPRQTRTYHFFGRGSQRFKFLLGCLCRCFWEHSARWVAPFCAQGTTRCADTVAVASQKISHRVVHRKCRMVPYGTASSVTWGETMRRIRPFCSCDVKETILCERGGGHTCTLRNVWSMTTVDSSGHLPLRLPRGPAVLTRARCRYYRAQYTPLQNDL